MPIPECFPTGTEILMADDGNKNIEDVEVGDLVMSWDFDNNEKSEGLVVGLWNGEHDDLYIINDEIEVTSEHPFYSQKGWKSIEPKKTKEKHNWDMEKLEIGDYLMNKDGKFVEVFDISPNFGNVMTYNLRIMDYENYFVEGILVHNKAVQSHEALYDMLVNPEEFPDEVELIYNDFWDIIGAESRAGPFSRRFRWDPESVAIWYRNHGPNPTIDSSTGLLRDGFEDADILMAKFFERISKAEDISSVEICGTTLEGVDKKVRWDVFKNSDENGDYYEIFFSHADITQ